MIILHFIQQTNEKSSVCQYLKEILKVECGEDVDHVIVTTSSKDIPFLSSHVRIFRIPLTIHLRKQFYTILEDVAPSVVHIHSLVGLMPYLIFNWTRKKRIPIVLSTYKKMMRWNVEHHYAFSKLPRLLLMQHDMIKRASAVHAITYQEADALRLLSWHPMLKSHKPWNEKIECIVLNELNGSDRDAQHVAIQMRRLYRKVIDSNPFSLMTDADRETEGQLIAYGAALSIGISQERIFISSSELQKKINLLSAEQWRIIQLHCHDQGVFQLLAKATNQAVPAKTLLHIDEISRFDEACNTKYLEMAVPRIKRAQMTQLAGDYPHNEIEQKLCIMILNTRYLLKSNELSRCNLSDLYLALAYDNYNDYILEEMLSELGMHKFTSRILYVLHMSLGLHVGFMPFDMLNDYRTKKIMKKLFKSNIQ